MSVNGLGEADVSLDYSDRQSKPFRFKGEGEEKRARYHESMSSRKHHRHEKSTRHRSKRSKTSHLGEDAAQHGPSMRNLGPNRAFQESLFDALGDDEGAAFWEGVYGQPIHTYPNTYVDEETGEWEQMDDEEYAQYVRRKMWEKSREGIEAAKEEQRRTRAREKARSEEQERKTDEKSSATDADTSNFIFDFEIEASLRRGQRRKDQKFWQQLWKDYLQRWEDLQNLAHLSNHPSNENLFLRNKIAWPVESGKLKDVNPEGIERFITKGTESVQSDGQAGSDSLVAALKLERVRWHPDKIQQRYGFMQIDETTMKGVTASFQVFDRMWNELRETSKR